MKLWDLVLNGLGGKAVVKDGYGNVVVELDLADDESVRTIKKKMLSGREVSYFFVIDNALTIVIK